MHSQISVEVFPSSRCCLPEHTLRNSGFNRFTAALLKGRLKFCFLHNAFYEIQRRRIPTFSDHTRLHGQVHGTCVSRVTCAVAHEFPDHKSQVVMLSVVIAGNFFCRSFAHAIRLEIACQQCKCQRFAWEKLRQKNSCPFPESCRGQQAQVTRKHMSRGPGTHKSRKWSYLGTNHASGQDRIGHAETRVPQSTMRACPT